MNRREQAFIKGFVKRAAEYGVRMEEAHIILKSAASAYDQELQKMKSRYGTNFEPAEVILPPDMQARRDGVPFDKVPFGYNASFSRNLPQGELYGEPEKYYAEINRQRAQERQNKQPQGTPVPPAATARPAAPVRPAAPAVISPAPQLAQNKATQTQKMQPFFEQASKYFPDSKLTTDPQQQTELAQLTQKYRTNGAPPLNMEGIKNAPQVVPARGIKKSE